jgi:hypothetical protein
MDPRQKNSGSGMSIRVERSFQYCHSRMSFAGAQEVYFLHPKREFGVMLPALL